VLPVPQLLPHQARKFIGNREVKAIESFDWQILKSEHLVKDKWISLRADTCKMPNGRIVTPYYVYEYPTWVNVVAITKQKEVVLVQQYRHGYQKTLLELPSGGMELTDKSPSEAIKRELIEETGYTGAEFIHTCTISANPANHNNLTHCFLALDVELTEDILLDETEQIKVVLKPLKEVITSLINNDFLQSLHVSSLFHALMYMDILKFIS
jgi:8-oxo-dGTP pyrophosphatase MutT (NUDIX family)